MLFMPMMIQSHWELSSCNLTTQFTLKTWKMLYFSQTKQDNMVKLWTMFLRIWTIQDKAPSQYQHLNTRSTSNNMVQQLACNYADQRMKKWTTLTLLISLMSMNGSHIMKATDQTMLIFQWLIPLCKMELTSGYWVIIIGGCAPSIWASQRIN